MSNNIKKQSTIKSLLVVPLIASAILFSSPAFITNSANTPNTEVSQKGSKKGIVGTVDAVNGVMITVTGRDGVQYIVDASLATIMKVSEQVDTNPVVVATSDIHVGDQIGVRGQIDSTDFT